MLYRFQGAPDGAQPWSGLIADKHGNLFGTTNLGGTGSCSSGCGTVFELSPQGKTAWTETTLYSFQGGSDGADPDAALVMDGNGNLYGITADGGTGACNNEGNAGCGTVFELSSQAHGKWSESVLYRFQGAADLSWPNALVFGKSGRLFGTAYNGGSCCGGLFELAKHRGSWRETVIYSGDEAASGPTGVLFDAKGNIYSVSAGGGPETVGEVFMLTPPSGKGEWTKTDLYDFQNQYDGALPIAGLVFDAAGDLFGASDGTDSVYANIFELTPGANGTWSESVVISFADLGYGYPSQSPVMDSKGNLLGETSDGGRGGDGTVYEVSPNNGGWNGRTLYNFTGGNDGSEPLGGVLLGKGGKLYGTTSGGGANACNTGCGTVFRIQP